MSEDNLYAWAAQRFHRAIIGLPVRDADELLSALDKAALATPPTYAQGQEEIAHRLQRVLEDLDYIEGNWPNGFDDAWPFFDEPREKIAVACQEMLCALPVKEGGE